MSPSLPQIPVAGESEDLIDDFFAISPSLMMVVGFDGVLLRVNPTFIAHIGRTADELVGTNLSQMIHHDDWPVLKDHLTTITRGEVILGVPIRTVTRRGRVRWVELSGGGIAERQRIFLSGIDITSRRRVDEALRDSEQRFRELAENISEVFWLTDAHLRRTLYASPAFEALWGVRISRLVQSPNHWRDSIHPDDRPHAEQAFRHLVEEGDMDVEYRIVRPDGSERWIHDRGFPVMSEDGTVARIAGIASDITDRKHAQQALQSVALGTASATTGERFFQTLLHHAATALRADDAWLAEPSEQPDRWRVLGWWSQGSARDEKTLTDAQLPNAIVFSDGPQRVTNGACRHFPRHGLLTHREAYIAVPVADSSGRRVGVLSVAKREPMEDLANVDSILQIFAARAAAELERQRAEARAWQREEELAHVGRLQTMGEMASGIAHELNQPLLAIMTHAAAARLGLSKGSATVERDLIDIELQAERAAAIIQRLRSFVQRRAPEWAQVDLNGVVLEVLRFMTPHAQRFRATLESELFPDLPSSLADRVQVEQVLVNLINNALEALGRAPESDRRVIIRTQLLDAAVLVAVDDDGPGLPDHFDPFEPFVSTKSGGLGIGLPISRSIIERHQGYLWHEPLEPRGARFAFRLPIDESPLSSKSALPPFQCLR